MVINLLILQSALRGRFAESGARVRNGIQEKKRMLFFGEFLSMTELVLRRTNYANALTLRGLELLPESMKMFAASLFAAGFIRVI